LRIVPARLLLVCALIAVGHPLAAPAHQLDAPFDVIHYAAHVEPDITGGTVRGTVAVSVVAGADGLRTITLDRGVLQIDAVRQDDDELTFTTPPGQVEIRLRDPAAANERRRIQIDYHGAPRYGLELVPDRSQAYTIFSTSQWMPAVDAPAARATLDLTVVVPAGLVVVANGEAGAVSTLDDDRESHGFELATAAPSYTFGFAAGPFHEVDEEHGGVTLRYLADGFDDDALRRVFADTPAMLDFFVDRAGVPYAADTYTQALVVDTVGQEMTGFSLMSEEYGRRMLADPAASSLGAHEMAHQWWGNMVTCVDWRHFWLNEGFATFMAAAWMEQRFGRERYLAEVDAMRQRYERVRDEGNDKPLVFPDWNRPTSADRTLVYQKGAYVLHLLREQLGDDAFWDGVRHYTRTHFGQSVTTADFQEAMEQSSGRDLSAFFDEWVYAGS
jgi:aminopeptidase N